ncbi:MAG TPA: CoA pyrophosphatase [Acidimicrobiales bacterium]
MRGGRQVIPRPVGARAGRPAPWAHLPAEDRRVDVARVRRGLAVAGAGRPTPLAPDEPGAPHSAVLVPLYDEGGAAHVVLTRRAQHLRSHKGEVSFPGGRGHPGEDPRTTALRETEEEIGLPPSAVEVVGELDHLTTISSATAIVPLVGVLPGRPEVRPNPGEVEAVLFVPLEELLAEGVFREERWVAAGLDRPIWFFELVGDTVWGATAAMLRQLLALVTGTAG